MEEECTICLEPLNSSKLGIITCNHYYHDTCILTWSKNSNSCPSCRKLFYKIDIQNSLTSKDDIHTIKIQDKILPNDAINDIPQEYVISPRQLHPQVEEETSGVCSICSSSDYRSSANLISCISCNCKFHQNCLGLDDDQEWSCPMCDYRQDFVPNQRRRVRRRPVIRPTPANIRNPRLINHIDNIISQRERISDRSNSRITNPIRAAKAKLIIHNEHGELDDQFLYENEVVITDTPVMNGGILKRKEIKQLETLSFEELKSWESFDKVRNNQVEESEINNNNSTRRRRKKRETKDPIIIDLTSDCSSSSSGGKSSSRISNLMNQIKSNRSEYSEILGGSPSSVNSIFTIEERNNTSPSSPNLSPNSPNLSPTSPNLSPTLPPISPSSSPSLSSDLSYDQKSAIQAIIRDNLRPLYRQKLIKSEQDYITINKNASHKIYSTIIRSRGPEIFNDNKGLKQLVDEFLLNEINQYKLK